MVQDSKPTHLTDASLDLALAVRRFARALVGPTAAQTADLLAHEALAAAGVSASSERAFAEAVHLNRRRVRSQTAQRSEAGSSGDADRGESLTALISGMPLDERETLLIVTLAQFSYEAAARILDIPHATALSRLMRARARLDAARASPAGRIGHLRLVQ